MSHDIEAIKAANPIADVVGRHVKLRQSGKGFVGLCPFHADRKPSFDVSPQIGRYRCWACNATGDVIDFLQEFKGISFDDALTELAGGKAIDTTPAAVAKRQSMQIQRQADRQAEQDAARAAAIARWEAAAPATDANAYLMRKGVEPHMTRHEGDNLLVPVWDASAEVMSVQAIAPDGGKRFHPGAPVKNGRLLLGINMGVAYFCEGFATGASIFEAMRERVVVAFSLGGMADVVREQHAQGINCVIAADRKGSGEMLKLGIELGIPVFFPPDPHDDFNDLHKAEGADAVKAVLRGAPAVVIPDDIKAASPTADNDAQNEDDPVDIWARNDPPPLPAGLMPPLIEHFAVVLSRLTGADAGGFAMAAITICAALIPDTICLKPKRNDDGWRESARIWTLLVGDPSTRKTPIFTKTTNVIQGLDGAMQHEYDRALAQWQQDKKDGQEGDKPPQHRLCVDDATAESVQIVAKDNPNGILCFQDEMEGWFGGMEKYSGGKGGGRDRAFWNRSFNGAPYTVDRVGRKGFRIDALSVTMLGGVQPSVIRNLLKGESDSGLIQRFFPIILRKAAQGLDEATPDVSFEFRELQHTLHGLKPPQGALGDMPLTFDDDAQAFRNELERKHMALVSTLVSSSPRLASHIGKYDGLFARMCVIWHCIEHANEGALSRSVNLDTATRVATFMHEYLLRHAASFYMTTLAPTEAQDVLEDIAGYILAHEVETITPRTFERGSTRMRALTRFEMEPVCQQLEAFGWVTSIQKRSSSGTDKLSCTVNPRVHEMFRSKAEAERIRRKEGREAIKALYAEPKNEAAA